MQTVNIAYFLKESEKGIIVDVRSPQEYTNGHICGAYNIPIFSNEERAEVGTIYKQVSKEAAVEKGLEIVGPKMLSYVQKAKELSQGKTIYIYCWRGGMRSGSMAWLFETAGLDVVRLEGGYKAYRNNIYEYFDSLKGKFIVLAGHTGSGKTEILHELSRMGEQVLDLEGIANHRGSAFGSFGKGEQPSSEHFSNLIYTKLQEFTLDKAIWCENESISIGHVYMNQRFYDSLVASRIINISIPINIRIDRLLRDYGSFEKEMYIKAFDNIKKRLGYDQAEIAKQHIRDGDLRSAAEIALKYYDKGYNKATETKNIPFLLNITSNASDPDINAKLILEQWNKIKNHDKNN